jgi:uncharacterized protein
VRVVLDTNLLVSALIGTGLPRQLLDAAKAGDFELYTSEVLLSELLDVISRAKFITRLDRIGSTPRIFVQDIRDLAKVVEPHNVPRVVLSDPDDDHVLAAALEGHVDLIVSGDKRDILPLGSYEGIPIVSASEAISRLTTVN